MKRRLLFAAMCGATFAVVVDLLSPGWQRVVGAVAIGAAGWWALSRPDA